MAADVMHDVFPLSLDDAELLAALRMQILCGDHEPTTALVDGTSLTRVLPAALVRALTPAQRVHEADVVKLKHAALAGTKAIEVCAALLSRACRSLRVQCQRRYLKSLFAVASLAGAVFFAARQVWCCCVTMCA
jgi:hypothetical protein